MNEHPKLKETALLLAEMMPIFAVKFIKSTERKMRDILSPLQMHTLFTLSCDGKHSMSDLARLIFVSKQQLTPIIDKLIEMDLVVREHDQVDRRNVTIVLSEKGYAFIDEKREEMGQLIGDMLATLPPEDIEVLNRSALGISSVLSKLP